MLHWEQNADGDLQPRAEPRPVASAADVRRGVPHLDGAGALRVPPAAAVLAGYAYGPDDAWTGALVPGGDAAPSDPAAGWGRLRALLLARLAPLRALTGGGFGVVARGSAPPRALPSAAFDVTAEAGTRADAGFFVARLRLAYRARTGAELDGLSQGAESLFAGWTLDDAAWAARGFAVLGLEDGAAGGSEAAQAGGPVLTRTQIFAFHAWRRAPADADGDPASANS